MPDRAHNMDTQFTKRLKSLGWRVAMMAIAVALSAIADGLNTLELSPEVTVVLGLILGEISKYINTKTQ